MVKIIYNKTEEKRHFFGPNKSFYGLSRITSAKMQPISGRRSAQYFRTFLLIHENMDSGHRVAINATLKAWTSI